MVESHLKTLITQHFDPKKADLIFTEEGSVSAYMYVYMCIIFQNSLSHVSMCMA